MTDAERPKVKKLPTIKNPARINKMCHWCMKPQPPGEKFAVCGRCKTVCFCSKECQRASWKTSHKNVCKDPMDIARNPEDADLISSVKRWHAANIELIKNVYIVALDLQNKPENVTKKVLMMPLVAKPDAKQRKPEKRFLVQGSFDMSMEEAESILLKQGGSSIITAHQAAHKHMTEKGGMGVGMVMILAEGVVDVLQILLPGRVEVLEIAAEWDGTGDWRENLDLILADDEAV